MAVTSRKYRLEVVEFDETGKHLGSHFEYTDILTEPVKIKQIEVIENFTIKTKEVVIKEKSLQSGTLIFNNNKKAILKFKAPFEKMPRVTLTMQDTSVTNPYTTNVTKTGFVANFQNNFTGQVEWIALERE